MKTHSKCLPAAIVALALLLSACASASDNGRSFGSSSCAAPGDPVTAEAVTQYLKDLTPKPQRFLVQSTGDSALPDAGREVLQNTGPTYLFPTDTAKQQTVLSMLTAKGPFLERLSEVCLGIGNCCEPIEKNWRNHCGHLSIA